MPHDSAHLDVIVRSVAMVEFDADIARQAAALAAPFLKTLDAIHLATAVSLGATVDAFVTYDDRLAEAARGAGLTVVRPA